MEAHVHLSAEEKKAVFTSVTITHRQLEAVHAEDGTTGKVIWC